MDLTHLQAFMYIIVHGAFQYGITAPFRHLQLDPPPPQPQHHLQGIEDCDQLPQRVSPHALAASATRNQIQRRRIDKPQQMATKVNVETLRTAEQRSGDDTDAQLCDTEQSLSTDTDSEELLQSPAELTGAGANVNTAWTKNNATNSNPQSQTKQMKMNKKQINEEAGKLNRASKPPAEEHPSQTGIQVTFI